MEAFCPYCGEKIEKAARVCPGCRRKQPNPDEPQNAGPSNPGHAGGRTYTIHLAGHGEVREGIPVPGYSDRVNHPELVAAHRKVRRSAGVFLFFLFPVPLAGFAIYGNVTEDMPFPLAVLVGTVLSLVILAYALYSRNRGPCRYPYEATVIGKKKKLSFRRYKGKHERVVEYVTLVRTREGAKKRIRENGSGGGWAFDYLQMGARFKYHPQFHCPYELYDKASAPYLLCVNCGAKNPIAADRCMECRLPLLK